VVVSGLLEIEVPEPVGLVKEVDGVARWRWWAPEHDDGLWWVLSRYFVPEENLRKRADRDRVPYDVWTRQG
jgi:hypothetical protein